MNNVIGKKIRDMLCIQHFFNGFSKKKKTNFSGKFKLKPIASYTYNLL